MHKVIGVSLPEETLAEIDNQKGDVSRSRYLTRLVEIGLKAQEPQTTETLSEKPKERQKKN